MTPADQQDEFGIIAKYFAPLTGGVGETFSLTDDAAILDVPPGQQLVMTKDMLVAGVHFFADDAPDLIARKLLRVNVSDLAAMGATPLGYLLGFGPTLGRDVAWIERFASGLALDQQEFGMSLLGGDSIVVPHDMTFSITAFGLVPQGKSLTRSGTKAGDTIYVTGTIGDGAVGLAAVQNKIADRDGYLAGRYYLPQPRVSVGERLHGVARAALDVSDGLVADLHHMAVASGVLIRVDANDIPLSGAVRRLLKDQKISLETIVTGGDDYELVFAAPPGTEQFIAQIAKETGVAINRIGYCAAGEGVEFAGPDGQLMDFAQTGYNHFR
ncbi:MAG: thiamine-phosphate kinase [Alphaproteobacteria bacterium]|nr:MAG: thiamine-phosphate kinase [Alphaproteobacteria bacterium]